MSDALNTEVEILKANQKELQRDVGEIKLKLHEYELDRVRTSYELKEELKTHISASFDKVVELIEQQNGDQDRKRDKHIADQDKINNELRDDIQKLKDKPMVEAYTREKTFRKTVFENVLRNPFNYVVAILILLQTIAIYLEK